MHLAYQFIKSFKLAKKRKWDKIYVAVDIHETTLIPCWHEKETYKFYPLAKKVLRMLSKRKDVCLILWSSCNKETSSKYLEAFAKEGINFKYINENPECPNTDLACFDSKFYMNVGIDDKFGFIPYLDWFKLYVYLILIQLFKSLLILFRFLDIFIYSR